MNDPKSVDILELLAAHSPDSRFLKDLRFARSLGIFSIVYFSVENKWLEAIILPGFLSKVNIENHSIIKLPTATFI